MPCQINFLFKDHDGLMLISVQEAMIVYKKKFLSCLPTPFYSPMVLLNKKIKKKFGVGESISDT